MSSDGFDYSQLVASGAIGGNNARSGSAIGEGQPLQGGMMPGIEGKELHLPQADVVEVFSMSDADSMFASIKEGALGKSLTSQLGDSANFLGAQEAKGDNIALENLGQGERQQPPTVQGDLQLNKGLSFKGNSGAAPAA